jgi:hypothetical protein
MASLQVEVFCAFLITLVSIAVGVCAALGLFFWLVG